MSYAHAADKLPGAGQVLDRYIKVTGGAAAWHAKKYQQQDLEGRTLDGARVVLRATLRMNRSGDVLSRVQVPQEASEGVYRGTAWALTRFSGERIKRSDEKNEAIREARMLEDGDWRTYYPKSQVTGIEDVGVQRCYRVEMLPSAVPRIEWFDVNTGLLVRQSTYEISTEGDTHVGFTVEAWTETGGVMQPSQAVAWRGDFQYRLTTNTLYKNQADANTLRYPEEVAQYVAADRKHTALPNAEEIIERHIYESGGPELWTMLRTQRVTGTLQYVGRGIEARMETYTAAGGRFYQSIDTPGLGRQEEGSDGQVAWDRSTITGPRVKRRTAGTAMTVTALNITLDAAQMIEWRGLLSEVRTEADESVDGRDCYRVRLTARDGSVAALRWYEKGSGLLYRSQHSLKTDMGAVPVVMTYEAYRDVEGIRWPSQIRMAAEGQDLLFRAGDVRLNEEIDQHVFELPEEIRQLAERKAPAGEREGGGAGNPAP